jgi:hypothetical protein
MLTSGYNPNCTACCYLGSICDWHLEALQKSTAFSPLTTVPYLLDVHGLSLSEAYLLAQRNLEACS